MSSDFTLEYGDHNNIDLTTTSTCEDRWPKHMGTKCNVYENKSIGALVCDTLVVLPTETKVVFRLPSQDSVELQTPSYDRTWWWQTCHSTTRDGIRVSLVFLYAKGVTKQCALRQIQYHIL